MASMDALLFVHAALSKFSVKPSRFITVVGLYVVAVALDSS
jgi:hypothetical protein